MLYNSNKKCSNFEIVLITGEQKNFLKITINMRRSFIGWQLVSSHVALNKKSKISTVTAATNQLKTNQNS